MSGKFFLKELRHHKQAVLCSFENEDKCGKAIQDDDLHKGRHLGSCVQICSLYMKYVKGNSEDSGYKVVWRLLNILLTRCYY